MSRPCCASAARRSRRPSVPRRALPALRTPATLGHRPVQLDARDLLRMVGLGWRPGGIELLVADPPCTPWSRAGKKRGLDDERDMLEPTCELIRLLKPQAYLIGNIPGLQDRPAR